MALENLDIHVVQQLRFYKPTVEFIARLLVVSSINKSDLEFIARLVAGRGNQLPELQRSLRLTT